MHVKDILLIKHYFVKFTNYLDWALVATGLTMAAGHILEFTIPVRQFLILTFFMVISDTITGVIKSIREKTKILSSGLRRTFSKILVYFIVILLAQGMTRVFFPFIPLAFTVALAITATEFKSNIENVEAITGVTIWAFIKDKIKVK